MTEEYGGETYDFCRALTTYLLSIAICTHLGAVPAVPRTAEENEWMLAQSQRVAEGGWWLGLVREGDDWETSDRSPLRIEAWGEGQPDGNGDCAISIQRPPAGTTCCAPTVTRWSAADEEGADDGATRAAWARPVGAGRPVAGGLRGRRDRRRCGRATPAPSSAGARRPALRQQRAARDPDRGRPGLLDRWRPTTNARAVHVHLRRRRRSTTSESARRDRAPPRADLHEAELQREVRRDRRGSGARRHRQGDLPERDRRSPLLTNPRLRAVPDGPGSPPRAPPTRSSPSSACPEGERCTACTSWSRA